MRNSLKHSEKSEHSFKQLGKLKVRPARDGGFGSKAELDANMSCDIRVLSFLGQVTSLSEDHL